MLMGMKSDEANPNPSAVPWWKRTVIYQIYPRSFMDGTGDGIGDLPGILSRLDSLRELGVETLWLSPVYPGPQKDFGYDISDYTGIHREYGTMEDFDRLVEAVHARGMKLLMDMVLNHTSDDHPWFRESASSRDNPRRDWYVWKEGRGKGGKRPPNNWLSQVSGSGWHRDSRSGQWYWASFLPFQPDLNWRNPLVREEMFRVLRFWLDRGVDGFRLDIIGSVYEDPEFRDNPRTWKPFSLGGEDALLFQTTLRTKNHPDNFLLARELRKLTDSYGQPEKILIGEVFGSPETVRRYCGQDSPDGLHSVFLFQAAETPFRAAPLRRHLEKSAGAFPDPFVPTLAFSNHDRIRRISALKNRRNLYRMSLLLQLTAPGIPCLYYGEEIGMPQARLSHRRSLDAVTGPFRNLPSPLFRLINRLFHGAVFRDECRTPMIWNGGPNGGFCPKETAPWLPLSCSPGELYSGKTGAPGEDLRNFLRELIRLRRAHPALETGTFRLFSPGQAPAGAAGKAGRRILGYSRQTGEETLAVFLNLSDRRGKVSLSGTVPEILLETGNTETAGLPGTGGLLTLPPWTGVLMRLNPPG